MKKKKQSKNSNRNFRNLLLPAFIVSTILSLVLLFTSVVLLYRENKKQNDIENKNDIVFFITKAIEGLAQEAPTASYSNIQFIDSAKVKFTKTEGTSLVYSYNPRDNEFNQSDFIQISSKLLMDSSLTKLKTPLTVDESLNLVPGIQNCSRLFIVNFEDILPVYYPEYSKINSKLLADGRTAYIWKATGELCMGGEEFLSSELLNVINTIESY